MSFFELKKRFLQIRDSARHLIAKFRYDFEPSGEPFSALNLKRAVIYRADGKIGDAICFLPFIRELKRFSPGCEIVILSNPGTAEIYHSAPFIDRTVILTKKPENRETDQITRQIGACDLYVHLFEKLKSRHLRLISRLHPKWVSTLDSSLKCDSLALHRCTVPEERGEKIAADEERLRNCLHITDLLFRILELGGIPPSDIDRSYFRLFADRIPASGPGFAFLRSEKTDDKTLIFNPYGASSTRRLSDSCIISTLKILTTETAMHIVLWTGPGDREHGLQLLAENFQDSPDRISVTGSLSSVSEVIAAMASCDAMIGVDTGSAHVAACYNIPELTFYRQNMGSFTRWYAKSPSAVNVILKTENLPEADPTTVTDAVQNFLAELRTKE